MTINQYIQLKSTLRSALTQIGATPTETMLFKAALMIGSMVHGQEAAA